MMPWWTKHLRISSVASSDSAMHRRPPTTSGKKNYCRPDHKGANDARNVESGARSVAAAGLRLHLGFCYRI
jgi:hypothetical protein